jgi:hypothetical protein
VRLNRTRTAAAVASAAAIAVLPIVLASPAGAQPLGAWDVQPEPPAALELGIAPDPDRPADATEPDNAVLADTPAAPAVLQCEKVAKPATDPIEPVVDLDSDSVRPAGTEQPSAPDVPSSPDGSDHTDNPTADSGNDQSGNNQSGNDQSGNDRSGDDGADSASAGNSDSSSSASDSSDESASDEVTTDSTKAGGSSTAAQTRVTPLADTGAAVGDLLRTGLALLIGGIVVAGAGRHRRPGPAQVL